jgi:hypothetical protein
MKCLDPFDFRKKFADVIFLEQLRHLATDEQTAALAFNNESIEDSVVRISIDFVASAFENTIRAYLVST